MQFKHTWSLINSVVVAVLAIRSGIIGDTLRATQRLLFKAWDSMPNWLKALFLTWWSGRSSA